MDRRNEDTALLALRGGLRGRFRRSFDSMENAFEVLQDRLQHAVNPTERAELMPLLEELQTQLICLRRLGTRRRMPPRRRCCTAPVCRSPSTCWGSCGNFAVFCRRRPRSTRCPLP
ncbi:hypothetical protein NIA69_12990 [Gemmiger formicilis]|nr:hypothetical protein [Gemmiger formicilis]